MGLLRPLPAPEEAPGRASLSPSSTLQRVSRLGWSRRGSAASSSRMQVLGCNCPLCSALWLSPGSLASHPCAQSPSLAPAPAAAGVLPAPGTFSLHPPKKPLFSTPVASRPRHCGPLWPSGIPVSHSRSSLSLLCYAMLCYALLCNALPFLRGNFPPWPALALWPWPRPRHGCGQPVPLGPDGWNPAHRAGTGDGKGWLQAGQFS